MRIKSTFAVAGLLAMMAPAAQAGGYVAPVQEAPVVVAPIAEPVSDWAGGYAGGWIGYAFGADDEVGFDLYEDSNLIGRQNDITNLDVSGLNGGLHLGYRWQRGSWVFGPELTIEGGDISDEQGGSGIVDGDAVSIALESKVNYIAGVQMKAGLVVNPKTMVYGTAGYVHGDFDYILSGSTNGEDESATEGYTANGYSLGAGVERKLNERWSMFAEWQYRNFGKTDVTFSDDNVDLVTRATPEHHNLKLGVNFAF
ncbi:porin family protein [Paracoccus sp. 11-3]|uniref:Porin family protein n=1 Tax=Paracoccus amoyensis TaxID=2760093 RepID=A0A926JBU5_9RHOB|nr:outer membrane beta-barrel protein [Paracoccus amoyensis]MBC9246220.1 porin family protein [Paracoccus amoyensis]